MAIAPDPASGLRSGAAYIDALRDERSVYLDGERVADVTEHPAFRPQIRRIASLFDRLASPEHAAHVTRDAASGAPYSNAWLIARDVNDLRKRRAIHEFWAEASYGLMGRSPDHVAAVITGFAAGRSVFDRGGAKYGDNVLRFYEKARRESLYVASVFVPPQVDRAKSAAGQPEPFLYTGVVAERPEGIVIRGASMIGTAAVFSDYLLVTYIAPLQAGDEDYAVSFVVKTGTPGVKLYPRRPYNEIANSVFDYPLSSRLDETDSLVVFDDAVVPWENVFIYKNVPLLAVQFHDTGAHLYANLQAMARFAVKLRFAGGLAHKLAELHNIGKLPPVQALLGGKIATNGIVFDALVLAAENTPLVRDGYVCPDPQFIYTGMTLQRQWIVPLMQQLRELAGGAFLAVPGSDLAFSSPHTSADTERYYASLGTSSEDRVKFIKLMWDFVGTEFAGRQLQYEMFYSAAQHVADARVYNVYDWNEGRAMVDLCLGEYSRDTQA